MKSAVFAAIFLVTVAFSKPLEKPKQLSDNQVIKTRPGIKHKLDETKKLELESPISNLVEPEQFEVTEREIAAINGRRSLVLIQNGRRS